jgi:hypothetical protein
VGQEGLGRSSTGQERNWVGQGLGRPRTGQVTRRSRKDCMG